LCQITSNPHSDPSAIRLTDESFSHGSLHTVSFARPTKLFTAHSSLTNVRVAILNNKVFTEILNATIGALQSSMPD